MKKLLTLSVVLFLFCATITAQIKIWDKRFGGNLFDETTSSLATPDNAYLLGGRSSSGASGDKSQPTMSGSGDADFWVVKMDEGGSKIWDRRFGGTLNEYLSTMVVTAGNRILLGGWTESEPGIYISQPGRGDDDFWIMQMDLDGNRNWDKRFGGNSDDWLTAIARTSDGGYLLGGRSWSNASGDVSEAGRGSDDFWVVRVDLLGNKLWDKRYGGSESDFIMDVLPTSDGGFLLAGCSASNIGSEKSENSRGTYDFWIVKIDRLGNKIWDRTLGGDHTDLLLKLLATPDGGYLLGGRTLSGVAGEVTQPTRSSGQNDFWLVKIDGDGHKIWDRRYGGNSDDRIEAMQALPDGNFLLGGTSYSDASGEKTEPSRGRADYWIIKINSTGTKLWDKTYGGDEFEYFSDITAMPDNKYLLAGWSESDLSGDRTQPTRGRADFWTIKLNPTRVRRITPRDFIVACSPLCPPLDVDIASLHFEGIAAFSFRLILPVGKAAFNKSGHVANQQLEKGFSFKVENEQTLLVTWKNDKGVTLPDETTLMKASVQILSNASDFEICVADLQAFDEKGTKVDFEAGCGNIKFTTSKGNREATESVSKDAPEQITIFPNPGTGIFNITLPYAGDYRIAVRDARGTIVSNTSVSTKENNQVEKIDLKEAPVGMYLVVVKDGTKRYVGKIVKR